MNHNKSQRPKAQQPWSKPFLRWAGSKRKLLPVLISSAPSSYRRYVEPFAGSACLFFALHPKNAILGDINAELLATYKTLKEHPRLVSRQAEAYERADDYYGLRSQDPSALDSITQAARFLYLNRHCFNGVYRTNRHGQFNVPKGQHTGRIPTSTHLYRCSVALRAATLRRGDFERCLAGVGQDDFVYLDPPYAIGDRPTFGEYGYGSFESSDIARLIARLKKLDKSGAKILLSYAESPDMLRALPRQWKVRLVGTQRHVAGFARHRRKVEEVLVSNYAA